MTLTNIVVVKTFQGSINKLLCSFLGLFFKILTDSNFLETRNLLLCCIMALHLELTRIESNFQIHIHLLVFQKRNLSFSNLIICRLWIMMKLNKIESFQSIVNTIKVQTCLWINNIGLKFKCILDWTNLFNFFHLFKSEIHCKW